MSDSISESSGNAQLRVMQIINAALVMGAFSFMAVIGFIRLNGGGAAAPAVPIVSYFLLAIATTMLVTHFVVPKLVASKLCKQVAQRKIQAESTGQAFDETRVFWGAYQTCLILGLAFLEAASFMMFVAYLLEGVTACLLVGALFVAGMALKFPTRERVESWVGMQRKLVYQEQS